MKTLTTEQQNQLRDLLKSIFDGSEPVDTLQTWIEELKPKRIRRKKELDTIAQV
jgi:hypothetical protein